VRIKRNTNCLRTPVCNLAGLDGRLRLAHSTVDEVSSARLSTNRAATDAPRVHIDRW